MHAVVSAYSFYSTITGLVGAIPSAAASFDAHADAHCLAR